MERILTRYADLESKLQQGGVVLLDGGTGTELQRRGVAMDPAAWCGPASLESTGVLEAIHLDYISAGAEIITANTYASSRLMLEPAGFGDRFTEINRAAVRAAHRARAASGRDEVLIAGSLSHMCPMIEGTGAPDQARTPSQEDMAAAFTELAALLRDEGCDLIVLEMMYDPARVDVAFEAAQTSGLPVWAGFSARRGADGRILSFLPDRDIPFEDMLEVLERFDVKVAGVMHTPSDVVGEALELLRRTSTVPMMAYPDSGYFMMPAWQFEDVIRPPDLVRFAAGWVAQGAQIVGGCCGLTPDHIHALATLKGKKRPG